MQFFLYTKQVTHVTFIVTMLNCTFIYRLCKKNKLNSYYIVNKRVIRRNSQDCVSYIFCFTFNRLSILRDYLSRVTHLYLSLIFLTLKFSTAFYKRTHDKVVNIFFLFKCSLSNMSYVKLLMYPNFDFYNNILQFVLYLINIHQFGPKLECKSLN